MRRLRAATALISLGVRPPISYPMAAAASVQRSPRNRGAPKRFPPWRARAHRGAAGELHPGSGRQSLAAKPAAIAVGIRVPHPRGTEAAPESPAVPTTWEESSAASR